MKMGHLTLQILLKDNTYLLMPLTRENLDDRGGQTDNRTHVDIYIIFTESKKAFDVDLNFNCVGPSFTVCPTIVLTLFIQHCYFINWVKTS